MSSTQDTTTTESDALSIKAEAPAEEILIEEELLVEEISIDGMCGVY